MTGYNLVRPLLFSFDPELAHRLALRAFAAGVHPRPSRRHPALAQSLLGLDFPNPIGIAAGFDKNGEVPDALLGLGFGFTEVGTVTPLPQAGNPKPRVFRLTEHRALINRLGFNNAGFEAVHRRLAARTGRGGVVGVNIGANRDSPDRIADYAAGVTRFSDVADYFTINISSPNTPGLRDLQESWALRDLLDQVSHARNMCERRVPVFLKIAPDLDEAAMTDTVEAAVSAGVEGMIVANTTVARDAVADHRMASEAGGLSGEPLHELSTAMLAKVRKTAGDKLVLIGAGGAHSAETVLAKILAGA
ncbi:MAG: quinone-dependent dihydroorotate dehydrogenase, partial [Hyphomicrobiales bacterium]|nr:quinone-dependent dihydroorotate dehydrogenase [Hyphomicrobiales bacterium]